MKNDKFHRFLVHDSQGGQIGVKIVVNSRSRRIILRLDAAAMEGILVLPRLANLPEGRAFAAERADWLSLRLAGMPQAIPFRPGAMIPFRGQPTRLSLSGAGRTPSLVPGEITGEISGGSGPMLCAPGDEAGFERRVRRFIRREALADLTASVGVHCARLGVDARKITLKDTRSRWGSCTSDGRLAFSWRLVLAPPAVLDYVAAHECAHLIEMNHSPAFWMQVNRTYGDHRSARSWLKRHGHGLHAVGIAPPSEAGVRDAA